MAESFRSVTWGECGPYPVFACYKLAFALKLREKAREKNFSEGRNERARQKCRVKYEISLD
jgi:hypothetical protein